MNYASKSQAENGTDNTTIMTPLRVKQSIAANAGGGQGGTSDYNTLTNKPKINNVELTGNKTAQELGISGNIQGDWDVTDPTNGAYIKNKPTIPTKTSDLQNDEGFIDNTVNNLANYTTTSAMTALLNGKQDTLVSGTNIKTINNESLLGSGNITIQGGTSTDVQVNGTSITSGGVANLVTEGAYNATTNPLATMSDIESNVQSDWNETDITADSYIKNKPNIPTKVSDLQNDSGFLTEETDPVFGESVAASIGDDDIDYWNNKQPLLVSGTNIKTINNTSLLGSGNLIIGEGGVMATDVEINGNSITSDGSANIITDGAYDPETNKIATQSTVSEAIGDLIDYVYYQEEQFTNPILGTTALKGVVSVGKINNPIQIKLSDDVFKIRLNNSDVVYVGTDETGKTRIFANNMNALQSIKLGDFSWTKLSDGSIVFGGDE